MPHWLIKSALHRVISWLPNPQAWNYLLQEHVTKSVELGAGSFEFKIQRARKLVDDYFAYSPAANSRFTAVELGTGWCPVIPAALYLCGMEKMWTFDISPLLKSESLRMVLQFFSDYGRQGRLFEMLPRASHERLAALEAVLLDDKLTPVEMLARLNIEAVVRDARQTGLRAGSADLIYSETVLAHIPRGIIQELLAEFRRVAAPGAVMIHSISMWDYYNRFDSRLSEFNMLRYSTGAWKWFNSPVEPNNRLRVADYRALLQVAAFRIVYEETTSGKQADLDRVPVHEEFKRYSSKDILVNYAWLVSVPAAT